jgi:predicted short-subunit dehydrogenase-like oxidoreductase (DUF2520 family)
MNSSSCRIVLIGSGNVATRLGKAFRSAGHIVLQVWSRNIEHAELLARELGAEALPHPDAIEASADLVLVAVSDAAMENVLGMRSWNNMLLVHTSGVCPWRRLAPFSARRVCFFRFNAFAAVELNIRSSCTDGSIHENTSLRNRWNEYLGQGAVVASD